MNALLNKTIQNGTRRLHNRKQFLGQPASKFFQQCLEKTVQKCCVSVYMLKRTTVFGADMIENTTPVDKSMVYERPFWQLGLDSHPLSG